MRYAFDPLSRRPLIEIQCNKRPLRCVLDTGYSGWLWIHTSLARRYGIVTEEEEMLADTAGGDAPYKIGYVHNFLVAPVLYKDVPAAVHDSVKSSYPLLGMQAIREFIITIDCSNEFTDVRYVK